MSTSSEILNKTKIEVICFEPEKMEMESGARFLAFSIHHEITLYTNKTPTNITVETNKTITCMYILSMKPKFVKGTITNCRKSFNTPKKTVVKAS